MLTRIAVATSILCMILPAAGLAQGFSQGDKVLSLNGVGLSDEDFNNNTFSVSGDLSYFFTNSISGAIRQTIGFTNVEDGGSSWNASTRGALDYNFDLGRFWPFVGGNGGYVYGDDVKDTWVVGPEAGVRFFVNQTTFVVAMIEWEFFLNNNDRDDTFKDSMFIYQLGIGFRW